MANLREKFSYSFSKFAPCLAVCLTFLPNGLIFGYTIFSFAAKRNSSAGFKAYGSLVTGACVALIAALAFCVLKFFKNRIIFWHFYVLSTAALLNIIASCFYFVDNFDTVGAYISYIAHSLTFVAGLSYLHSSPGKRSRAILISTSFSVYALGIALAVNLVSYIEKENNPKDVLVSYTNFAAVYLSIGVVVLAVLVGLLVLAHFGTVDCEIIMDNDFRRSNANGTLFEKRTDIIKRIQFFYITKSQQWNVTFLLIFTEAIQYALFVYFIFWFALNQAISLAVLSKFHLILWDEWLGSVACTICLVFISVKVNFVATELLLIVLTILAMIICTHLTTTIPYWLILFCFGMSASNLQIAIIEASHFRATEVLIAISYVLKLVSVSIISYFYVSDANNSYFYSTDISTLLAQGFVFIIISSLLALIVGMKVPRTHRTSLLEIQYILLGIIFKDHQIEQLNVKWLNDGTIPTISRADSF